MRKVLLVWLVSAVGYLTMVAGSVSAGMPQGEASREGVLKNRTVWDGVYSTHQAERGKTAYQEACSLCHGGDLLGAVPGAGGSGGGNAPILAGNTFMDRWREDNLVGLFTKLRSSMPRQAVDTISDATKMDIFAFMLQENGFPAGTADLRVDTLGKIHLVGKDGPKPLPSTTPVRGVGCLTRQAGGTWMLMQAPEPYRTQRPGETTPEELADSKVVVLGTLSFRLPSLEFAIPGVRPGTFEGHKVQVKGTVYRQNTENTINVRSMESLASSCGP